MKSNTCWSWREMQNEPNLVLGNMSIGGTINKVEGLANTLQVCFDAGAKKTLLPMPSAVILELNQTVLQAGWPHL